jgi:hypothetical protein
MVCDYLLVRRGNVKLSSLVRLPIPLEMRDLRVVPMQPFISLLLLERLKLASSNRMGMWSSSPFPRILGDCIHSNCPTRSSEGLLPLFPA